jgi:hypothetical protein
MEQCNGKNCYTKNAVHKTKTWVGRRRGKGMRIYECPTCHWWHITNKGRPREARPEKEYD